MTFWALLTKDLGRRVCVDMKYMYVERVFRLERRCMAQGHGLLFDGSSQAVIHLNSFIVLPYGLPTLEVNQLPPSALGEWLSNVGNRRRVCILVVRILFTYLCTSFLEKVLSQSFDRSAVITNPYHSMFTLCRPIRHGIC